MKKLLTLLMCAAALTGCARPIGHYAVMSTNEVSLHEGHYYLGRKVTGQDINYIVVIPLGLPMMDNAVRDAVRKDPCAVGLVDGNLLTTKVDLFVGYESYETEGYLLLDADKEGCSYLKDHHKEVQ